MNSRQIAATLLASLLAAAPAVAAEAADVDTRYWRCRFCPFPGGLLGEVEGALGHVSDDAFKYGEYNGLEERGPFPNAGADLTWFGEGATRWDVLAGNLGLDTRSLAVSGGEQGRYELRLGYDQLVHNGGSAASPFRGAGSDRLTLPDDWVRASTTAGMTRLDADPRSLDIRNERERVDVGITFHASKNRSHSFDVRQEWRDGADIAGGAFIVGASQWVAPVDYRTTTLDYDLRYRGEGWQLGVGYYGSLFHNDNPSLVWDNPYTAVTPGSDRGRMSQPADNQFHQLNLSGAYRFGARLRFAGDLAVGRMTQDEAFLAPTINDQLAAPAPPRTGPDAQVDTVTGNGRLNWSPPVAGLSVTLQYRGEVRDNDTPRDSYTQVITDTFVGGTASNLPLSCARHTLKGRVGYRLAPGRRLTGGLEYQRYDRDYAGEPVTDEYTLWGEIRGRVDPRTEFRLRLAHARRTASGTEPATPNGAPQNPLMTWFDIAERRRNRVRTTLSFAPWDRVGATLSAEAGLTEHDDTVLGRTDRSQASVGLDVSAAVRENATVYAYLAHQIDRFEQRNSQGFAAPAWHGATDDSFNTAGLGGRIEGIRDKLDLSADLIYSGATGETTVDTGADLPGFPDFRDRRVTLRARGDYRFSERLDLGLSLVYETFRSHDWQLHGVDPDSVPRLLSPGRESADYNALVGVVSARYRF
jgi:MtrB/PioB family decaheme-associated outer membrane protein